MLATLFGLAHLHAPGCSAARAADVAPTRTRPLLGVQRWDMYSGKGATQEQEIGYLPGKQGFLKSPEWHDRAPFFCRLTRDVDWVEHPPNAGPLWCNYPFDREYLQKAMDQEIRYAYDAGIDFFVYHGPARKLYANSWELKNNLDAHMASTVPEARKMKFVWALYGHRAINYTRSKVAAMMDETIEYIAMPNWQKVMDGRPLVIVLWPGNFKKQLGAAAAGERMRGTGFTDYVRARVKAVGLGNPYIVGCMVPARSFNRAAELKGDGYDAFMDYSGGYGGAHAERDKGPTYAEATRRLVETYRRSFLDRELPCIPPCTSMQYPWPRAFDKKTGKPTKKWYHYRWPRSGDVAARVKAAFDLVAANPEACEAQTVVMYSWNEHSEGGGLCPTMGTPPEYKPVTKWLDEVAAALREWKYPPKKEASR
ncbi:MAG: glycoside hydrolase family 71/99 protein [Planctomycetota bacterium]